MLDRNPNKSASQIYVWDPFVRVFHWTLVAGFTIAYLTEEDLLTVHVWAGYVVGALVVARVLWGLIGPNMHGSPTSSTTQPRPCAMYATSFCSGDNAI